MNTDKKYLGHIDALRAIAALSVMLFHFISFQSDKGFLVMNDKIRNISEYGAQGVELFYVISGFIIFYTLSKKEYSLRKYGNYLLKRILRIYPPLIGVVAIISLIALVWDAAYPYSLVEILQNASLTVDCFPKSTWMNPIFATLKVEFIFYIGIGLIFPLLKANTWTFSLVLLFLLALGKLFITVDIGLNIPYFVLGISAAHIWLTKSKLWNLLPLLAAFVILVFYYAPEDWGVALIGVTWILFMRNSIPFLAQIGRFSYSIYLMHGSIGGTFIYFALSGNTSGIWTVVIILLAIVLSLSFSYLYYKVIEVKSNNLAKRY